MLTSGSVLLGANASSASDDTFTISDGVTRYVNLISVSQAAGLTTDSEMSLAGDLRLKGNGSLVTPRELTSDYEKTKFTGQTITKEQMNVWDGINPIEIDWNSGDVQVIDLNDQAAALVLNYPTNIEPGSYTIRFEQGGVVATPSAITFNVPISGQWYWPGGVPGAITNALNAQDILNIHSDGTNLYGTMTNNFL